MLKSARRTHTCGELRETHVHQEVVLQGWVDRARALGGVTFIDLRDRHGVVQVTVDHRSPEAVQVLAGQVRSEFILEVSGQVVLRSNPNRQIPSGLVEVVAQQVQVLSRAPTLPFSIREDAKVNEDTRLKYRYLDLRRPALTQNLVTRHRAALAVRSYLDSEGFIEVETPVLTRATPPQSPQLFKQILMVAGMDRYFQFVRCFRDEDLRADRQPEFTQIDLEMSFATRDLVMETAEGIVRTLWGALLSYEIGDIPRLSYAEALSRFGLDSPDMRFDLEHVELSEALAATEFRILRGALDDGGIVKAFRVPGGAGRASRKVLDTWGRFVQRYKLGGVLWGKVTPKGWSGPLGRLSEPERQAVGQALRLEPGDLLLMAAGQAAAVHTGLGHLREHVAHELGLVLQGTFAFCWVTDFPAFEYDDDERRWVAVHHPFTSPLPEHLHLLGTGREDEMLAAAYDLVCNGHEIAGGSIRIHDPEVQAKVFAALGLSAEKAEEKFGFLLGALASGAPPHGGIAFGFDRCAMLLCGTENIRDVIAFPKTTSGQCLMSGAPSGITDAQLKELHLKKG